MASAEEAELLAELDAVERTIQRPKSAIGLRRPGWGSAQAAKSAPGGKKNNSDALKALAEIRKLTAEKMQQLAHDQQLKNRQGLTEEQSVKQQQSEKEGATGLMGAAPAADEERIAQERSEQVRLAQEEEEMIEKEHIEENSEKRCLEAERLEDTKAEDTVEKEKEEVMASNNQQEAQSSIGSEGEQGCVSPAATQDVPPTAAESANPSGETGVFGSIISKDLDPRKAELLRQAQQRVMMKRQKAALAQPQADSVSPEPEPAKLQTTDEAGSESPDAPRTSWQQKLESALARRRATAGAEAAAGTETTTDEKLSQQIDNRIKMLKEQRRRSLEEESAGF